MPIVSSVATPDTRVQLNGKRYVTEVHTWDDGSTSVIKYGPVDLVAVDIEAIVSERAAQLEADRAEEAAQAFELGYAEVVAALKRGENPFPANNADFEFGTRLQVLGRIFSEYATAPATQNYIFAPYIDAVGDEEFAALGLTPTQIAAVRAKVEELKALREAVFAYQPLVLE